jgi:hypothetical protein
VPQYALMALLAMWAFAETGAGFAQLAEPPHHYGFAIDGNLTVTSVEAGSPAARAGLHPGDRVLAPRLDLASREMIAATEQGRSRSPATIVLPLENHGVRRTLRITSEAALVPASEWAKVIAAMLVTFAFVGVGVALVLLRPTRATWSFFFLATGYPIVQFDWLRQFFPPALLELDAASQGLALAVTLWGALSFAATFPDDEPAPESRRYTRPLTAAAFALGGLLFLDNSDFAGALRFPIFLAYQVGLIAMLIGLLAVNVLRRPRDPELRARGRWLLAGSIASLGGVAASVVLRLAGGLQFNGSTAQFVLALSPVLLPISVAYAVLRQRVIDVRFALNRALVFGAFTSVLVVAFSLAEFVVGKFESGRIAQNIELIAAIVVGFSFNLAHRRVEGYFERIFFRSQHEAAARLRRVIAAVPHAEAAETIDGFLVREPLEALQLVSATLYRRFEGKGDFRKVAGIGSERAPATVSAAAPLVAFLSAERGPLDLDQTFWPDANDDARAPILAVPVALRNVVLGFACYGPGSSGEAFDPTERKLLGDLAAAAAVAYAHLGVEELHRELAAMRAALALRGIVPSP